MHQYYSYTSLNIFPTQSSNWCHLCLSLQLLTHFRNAALEIPTNNETKNFEEQLILGGGDGGVAGQYVTTGAHYPDSDYLFMEREQEAAA